MNLTLQNVQSPQGSASGEMDGDSNGDSFFKTSSSEPNLCNLGDYHLSNPQKNLFNQDR